MASGALFLLIVASPALIALDIGKVTPTESGAAVYAGLWCTVVAYLLFYRGVRVLGPTRTSMYGNLQPLIAIAVAWLVLT